MNRSRSIFDRVKLHPTQLRAAADRRFDDAMVLVNTRQNARANGAIYLGGFVIECLLKAAMLEQFPWLQSAANPAGRSKSDQRLWSLCYRQHNLDELLARLPRIQDRLDKLGAGGQPRLLLSLKSICVSWTIFARYSPHSAMISEASDFLRTVKELKPWLR